MSDKLRFVVFVDVSRTLTTDKLKFVGHCEAIWQ